MGEGIKKIKILFTTSNFNTAGSGKVIYDLVNGLDRSKFDIEIACGNDKGDFFKTVKSLNVPIHIFTTKIPYRPYLTLLFRIQKIVNFYKQNKYDIAHSWQWSSDWTEALAAKIAGVKWIYTKKAMGMVSKHWHIKSYLADFIITINDEMHSYFPNKKAQKLIPLAVDMDYYNPKNFPVRQDKNSFKIITVANLVPVKGIEILIKAIHALNNREIRLTILGDNNNDYGRAMVDLSKSLGIKDQVLFIGHQSDVRPHLADSHLYVIPTLDQGRKEGMPMALVEAMAMAIPVLGSDISGIKYVLKNFPELRFRPNDVKALTNSIEIMAARSNSERTELGETLRTECLNLFSMQSFISAHEELYYSLKNKIHQA